MYAFGIRLLLFSSIVMLSKCSTDDDILETLLEKYKKTKPEEKTIITANMYIRSIKKIDTENQEIEMDVTFRQSWINPNLAWEYNDEEYRNFRHLTVEGKDENKIWVPDTFFLNDLSTHSHRFPTPNSLMMIYPDGKVLYSQRLATTLRCDTDVWKFPFDSGMCGIKVASYGYTGDFLEYKWKESSPIQFKTNLKANDFEFHEAETDDCTSITSTGAYSCIKMEMLFERKVAGHLMIYFVPSILLVCLSWVPMWAERRNGSLLPGLCFGFVSVISFILLTIMYLIRIPDVLETHMLNAWIFITIIFQSLSLLQSAWLTWIGTEEYKSKVVDNLCKFIFLGLYIIFQIIFWLVIIFA